MPNYVQDKLGRVWEDQGEGMGRLLTNEEVQAIGQNPLETLGKSAAVSAAQAYLGGKQLVTGEQQPDLEIARRMQAGMGNVNPIAQFAGEAAPALGVAALTGGSIPLSAAAFGAMGAAYAPEAPFTGAAIGALTGAAPAAVPALAAAGRAVAQRVPNLADPFLRNVPAAGIAGEQRMAGRVLQRMDAAAPEAAPGRFYKGLMESADLEAAGVPMTPAMRTALDATNTAQADFAKKQLWREGLMGIGEQERRAQRMYMTNLVKSEMGITENVALTDTVLNQVLKNEGQNIGRILQSRGPIAIPESALTSMRGVVDGAETGWQSSLANVVKNIEKSIDRNGALTPSAYQNAVTRLNEISAPGRSAGAIMDAKKLRDELSALVEGKLSEAERKLLAESRYRYKLAKTARQGRGVGSDMMINPATFGANWDKKIGQTARGQDIVGKAADTMNFLSTMEANAGTSLQRIFATAPGAVVKAAPGAAMSATGAAGLIGAANWLGGQL